MKTFLPILFWIAVPLLLLGQFALPQVSMGKTKSSAQVNTQMVISFIESRPDTLKLIGEVTPELLKFVRDTNIPIACLDLREAQLKNNEIHDFAFGSNRGSNERKILAASGIRSILLPEGLKRIGTNAFADCPLQGTIQLPESVEEIGLGAFYLCKGITSINIPKSCRSIGSNSFFGLSKLSGNVTIPRALTQFLPEFFRGLRVARWVNPFAGCILLTEIKVEEGNPVFTTDGKSLYMKDENKIILLSVMPSVIGKYTVAKHVTHIGTEAFYGSQLSEVQFQNNPLTLGSDCFSRCTNLTSLTIPKTVDLQGVFPFSNFYDSKPRTLILKSSKPKKLTTFFFGDQKYITVIVPRGAKKQYKKTEGWSDGWTIKEIGEKYNHIKEKR